jgi:hypothetical protein
MSPRQVIRRIIASAKLLLVCVAVVAYCASAVGIAIPLPAASPKVATEPFPCQHHRCGCQTADQCRRQCCCFSAEQKLAWARARGLLDREVTGDAPAASPQGKGCCQQGCRHREPTRPASCSEPWVDIISSAKCQGLATLWITLGVALPPSCRAIRSCRRTSGTFPHRSRPPFRRRGPSREPSCAAGAGRQRDRAAHRCTCAHGVAPRCRVASCALTSLCTGSFLITTVGRVPWARWIATFEPCAGLPLVERILWLADVLCARGARIRLRVTHLPVDGSVLRCEFDMVSRWSNCWW